MLPGAGKRRDRRRGGEAMLRESTARGIVTRNIVRGVTARIGCEA